MNIQLSNFGTMRLSTLTAWVLPIIRILGSARSTNRPTVTTLKYRKKLLLPDEVLSIFLLMENNESFDSTKEATIFGHELCQVFSISSGQAYIILKQLCDGNMLKHQWNENESIGQKRLAYSLTPDGRTYAFCIFRLNLGDFTDIPQINIESSSEDSEIQRIPYSLTYEHYNRWKDYMRHKTI